LGRDEGAVRVRLLDLEVAHRACAPFLGSDALVTLPNTRSSSSLPTMTFATGATSGEIERRQKRLCVKVGHESTAAVTRLDYAENGQRAQRFP